MNDEKTNLITMKQNIVSSNPEVEAALVVDTQRFQATLLLKLVNDEKQLWSSDRASLIEKIWPVVDENNKDCLAHARITKSHILFTHSQKPMLRAEKGTIQRAATVNLYEKELDNL